MGGQASDSPSILAPNGLPARHLFTVPTLPQAQVNTPFYGWGGGSYFGAQTSDARGQMLLPTKWAEDSLRTPERTVLALKSRVLAENYGPGAALFNLASLIGALKVQANSGDPTWDALAEEYWGRVTGSSLTFDAGGRFTLPTYQVMTSYRQMVDGDMFSVLTLSQSGHGRVMGYEGLMVEQALNQKAPEWIDGVQAKPRTRFPLAYNFLDRDEKNNPKYTVLPALSVIHHTNQRTFAGRRGVPALAHCLNNFHDLTESDGFIKQAIKVAALIGITRRSDPGSTGSPFNLGLSAPLQQSVYAPPTASAPTTLPTPMLKFEEAVEGGLMSTAPFDVVHDDRPHPNYQEHKKALLREAAIGLGFPQQLLFYMDDPGGAWTRVLLELAAKSIANHHANFLAPTVRRLWAYIIALGIKKGDLPSPQKGNWLKIRLTPPRALTADLGRMGRLSIELRQHLQTTFARLYEEMGMDYEDELEQCAREMQMLMKLETKYGLPENSMTQAIFPPQAATALVAPTPEPDPIPAAA